jgi:hypothetical protein
MKCPIDSTTLLISERSGIEIDYCPECRGVWLDRGELDKLIQGAGHADAAPARSHDQDHDERDARQSYSDHGRQEQKPKKRESFLGDMFDF